MDVGGNWKNQSNVARLVEELSFLKHKHENISIFYITDPLHPQLNPHSLTGCKLSNDLSAQFLSWHGFCVLK